MAADSTTGKASGYVIHHWKRHTSTFTVIPSCQTDSNPNRYYLHNGDGLCGIPGTFKENTAFIYWTYGLKRYAVVVAQYLVIYRAGVNYG